MGHINMYAYYIHIQGAYKMLQKHFFHTEKIMNSEEIFYFVIQFNLLYGE